MGGVKTGVTFQGVDSPDEFVKHVQQVEDWDYDYLWLTDSSLHARYVYSYLTLAALNTRRVWIGTNCTHPHTRHPAVNVNAHVTVNEISGGRVIMGVGVGDSPVTELGKPIAKMAEVSSMIEVARRLIRGERFDYTGPHFELKGASIHHGLEGVSPPKIYITASGPKMLQMAGELADGVIAHCGAFKEGLEFATEQVRIGARAAGRRFEDIDFAWQLFGALDDDLEAAQMAARPIAAWFPMRSPLYCDMAGVPKALTEQIRAVYMGGEFHEAHRAHELTTSEMIEKLVVAGPPAVWRDRIEMGRRLGVNHFEIFGMGDRMRLYGDLAARVFS